MIVTAARCQSLWVQIAFISPVFSCSADLRRTWPKLMGKGIAPAPVETRMGSPAYRFDAILKRVTCIPRSAHGNENPSAWDGNPLGARERTWTCRTAGKGAVHPPRDLLG